MKLEDQVTSLELSKRLKELGVKQDSLHWWAINHDGSGFVVDQPVFLSRLQKICSAFTASELLEMLPKEIQGDEYELGCNFSNKMNYVFYYIDNEMCDLIEQDEKLPNSCAKMLIHLIENNLLEIE